MNRLPPRSTRTDTLFLYTTLFRSLQFLNVVTKKGQGYHLAEADPVLYHGPGKFDPSVGIQKPKEPPKQTFTKVFGRWLCDMAESDQRQIGRASCRERVCQYV